MTVFYRYVRPSYFCTVRHNILIEDCGGVCFRFEDLGRAFPPPFPWRPEVQWAVNRGNKYKVSWAVIPEDVRFNTKFARREANRCKLHFEVIHDGSLETERLLYTIERKSPYHPELVIPLAKIQAAIKLAEEQHRHDRDVHAAMKLTERYDELSRG